MKPKNREPDLFEYKFKYHLADDYGVGQKYFLAHDRNEASRMFGYACRKNRLHPHAVKVEKWNRWRQKWENRKPTPPSEAEAN